MAVAADTQRAVNVLQGLQGSLVAAGDPELGEQVAAMIDLLASPSFRHLLNLQQSVRELKHHLATGPPGLTVEDFGFDNNGDLVLPEPESDQEQELPYRTSIGPGHPYAFENKMFEGDEAHITKTVTAPAASAPMSLPSDPDSGSQPELTRSISLERANEDLEQALRELALGREVLSIELMKQEGRGLGFSVVGLKSDNQGELGIFVQQIQKNGVASNDGRLRESDQILAINGALVDSSVSHKEAISMLQKVKEKVNLIVARGGLHVPTPKKPDAARSPPSHEPQVQGKMEDGVDDREERNAHGMALAMAMNHKEPLIQMDMEPEVNTSPPMQDFDSQTMLAPDIEVIDLYNKGSGLGFGIVGVRDIGIVVKTIVPGGAAEEDGRLQSGDIILRIGETDLDGMNSDQVASVLRRSGSHVQLVVARGALSVMQPSPHQSNQEDGGMPPHGLDLGQGQEEPDPLPVSPPPNLLEITRGVEGGNVFEVELVKGSQGLGLSIAGFIKKTPDGGDTSGIFVKKIADGSAAALSGNIRVGDQIIEVDGVSVQGYDNKSAVDLLRQTGSVVHLRMVRFSAEEPSPAEPQLQAQQAQLPDLTPPSLTNQERAPSAGSEDEPPLAPAPFLSLGGVTTDHTAMEDEEAEEEDEQSGMQEEDFAGELSPEEEIAVMALWHGLLGLDKDIVIAQLSKFEEGGSLGISLEGTVDIDETGQEVQPHHYIRSIQPTGPVGVNGQLESGDELLEVNGMRLVGLNHDEVVKILKDLPRHVRLVCARHSHPIFPTSLQAEAQGTMSDESLPVLDMETEMPGESNTDDIVMHEISPGREEVPVNEADEVISATTVKIEMTTPMLPALNDSDSPLDYSAPSEPSPRKESLWSDDIQYIELVKGDQGLGFSILDYQDPDNPAASVIVIRSLVPGGVAERDGHLIPGDRLVSVNESNLENCSLDAAVQVLKGAPRGLVQIGVAKPVTGMDDETRPASAQESSLLNETPPRDTSTTPMLPDVDISPLAAAIMAQEQAGEETSKVRDEAEVKVQPEVEVEPPVAAVSVSVAHTAPIQLSQQLAGPPDLVSSIGEPEPPKPASVSAAVTAPVAELQAFDKEAMIEDEEGSEERLPKIVQMRHTPPQGRKRSTVVLPSDLEETIVLKKTNAGLGLTVSADKVNGVVIKSIIRGGCVQQDGRLSVGDFITGVNGENMRNLTNTTARGVLRRCFLQGSDITVTYIAASKAAELLEGGSVSSESPMGTPPPIAPRPGSVVKAQDSVVAAAPTPSQESAPGPVESEWGEVRTVTINKEPGKTLGISIVGGRAGSDGQVVQGIFIKHILESSPAGKTGQLKTGDRILEVNNCDLREATHDQAVAVIRNASNPMHFQVQSLTNGSASAILQDVVGESEVLAVAATVVQAEPDETDGDVGQYGSPEDREAEGQSDSESEDEFGYTTKRLRERYRDLDGDLHIFELTKEDRGLGVSLAGNKDRNKVNVFVVGVNPNGVAGKDGRILIGDELLEINGIKVYGHSHQNASSIIGGLAPGAVKLVVLRNKNSINQLAVSPVIYPGQTTIARVDTTQDGGDVPDGGAAPAHAPLHAPPQPQAEMPSPTPEDYPNRNTITLNKGPRGLGFAIYESRDEKGLSGIFVKDVTMGGPAKMEGHLRVGDQILAVNDKSVIGLSKLSAISVLKDTKGAVRLTISSSKPFPSPQLPHSLFPNLDGVEGGVAFGIGQEESAGISNLHSGHGSFFPALDLGGETPKHDSSPFVDEPSSPSRSSSDTDSNNLSDSLSTSSLDDSRFDITRLEDEISLHDEPTVILNNASTMSSEPKPANDPMRCPVVKGQQTLIEVDKGFNRGLGISISGGVDKQQAAIRVRDVQSTGAAGRDSRLQPGDRILEVDGLEMSNVTHEAAINVLRQTGPIVKLLVLREDPPQFSPTPPQQAQGEEVVEEGVEVHTVVLHQPAGHSLGLSIAGKNGSLFVSDITPGSVAHSNGQLMRGDEILAVNGQAVKNIPQEALASLRQNAEGNVNLKVARRKDGIGKRMSMGSFEEVVKAEPVQAGTPIPGAGADARVDARAAFLQQQESFGSSTEMPPEDTASSQGSSVKTITLERGPEGLGFSIVGGYGSPHGDLPIYIKTVFDRGAAADARQLKRGDQILSVNGESLEGATHQMAVSLLKKARGQVTLTIVA